MSINIPGVAISALQPSDPLTGDELVPIVQDGVTKKTTSGSISPALLDVPEATVRGRAIGDGTGPVETLTEVQLGNIVWEDFSSSFARRNPNTNNIGYANVPAISTASRAVANNDCGQGIIVATAVSRTYTLPSDATDPDIEVGFVVTLAVADGGGTLIIGLGGGVILLDLRDGSIGSKTITGVGIATVWKIAANTYAVNGSANLA